MKTFGYRFDYSFDDYEWIINNFKFNRYKQEDIIFDMLIDGFTCEQIGEQTGLSERTIQRRRRDLHNRIDFNLKRRDAQKDKSILLGVTPLREKDTYCVYILTFPNHKMYIGHSSDPVKRWGNGNGYCEHKEMYNDIIRYGWENIIKTIVYRNLTYKEAAAIETQLILLYNTISPKYGYNRRSK